MNPVSVDPTTARWDQHSGRLGLSCFLPYNRLKAEFSGILGFDS